jgi:hypothetical protein
MAGLDRINQYLPMKTTNDQVLIYSNQPINQYLNLMSPMTTTQEKHQ